MAFLSQKMKMLRVALIEFSNLIEISYWNFPVSWTISPMKNSTFCSLYHALFAVSIRYWRKLFQNTLSHFLKSFKRACWMGKTVKEVNNGDREYALRYLWMSLERFEDLFNLAAPNCAKIAQMQSFFWPVFSPNTEKYGSETTPYLGTFLQSAADDIMRP